ncbi:unnamed protein product [Larinioides sclopetarius]
MTDCEIQDIREASLYMDVRSGRNHTTTINVYKVNYGALIVTLILFALIMMVFSNLWKGNKIRILKPPVSVVYYLAKCACFSGNADLIEFLIKRGADVHSVSKYGDSALYFAMYGLNPKVLDFRCLDVLLAAGCDINCQNNSGFTVLHLASSRGNLSLVQYLLLKGADPTISTAESILPYEMAAMKGHEETAKYLKNKICIERST